MRNMSVWHCVLSLSLLETTNVKMWRVELSTQSGCCCPRSEYESAHPRPPVGGADC